MNERDDENNSPTSVIHGLGERTYMGNKVQTEGR